MEHWKQVRIWDLESGREILDRGALNKLLAEYRRSGAIAGAVLADPAEYTDLEMLCEAGPSVDAINWVGFESEPGRGN